MSLFCRSLHKHPSTQSHKQQAGPHLIEFTPSGTMLEYMAMSIGARSQSARTYLERHLSEFADCDAEGLIMHGLKALRETLQQDKDLTGDNTSIVGRSVCTCVSTDLVLSGHHLPATSAYSRLGERSTHLRSDRQDVNHCSTRMGHPEKLSHH